MMRSNANRSVEIQFYENMESSAGCAGSRADRHCVFRPFFPPKWHYFSPDDHFLSFAPTVSVPSNSVLYGIYDPNKFKKSEVDGAEGREIVPSKMTIIFFKIAKNYSMHGVKNGQMVKNGQKWNCNFYKVP
jgi:hypothetical protein